MKVLINRIVYTRIEDVVNRNLTDIGFYTSWYKSLSNILKNFINSASYKTKKNGCFVDKIIYGYIIYTLTDTTDGRVLTIVDITLNRVPLPRINEICHFPNMRIVTLKKCKTQIWCVCYSDDVYVQVAFGLPLRNRYNEGDIINVVGQVASIEEMEIILYFNSVRTRLIRSKITEIKP